MRFDLSVKRNLCDALNNLWIDRFWLLNQAKLTKGRPTDQAAFTKGSGLRRFLASFR